jgi:hypothetical protein
MLCVYTIVKPSAVEGLGCFAAERIPRGRKVWQFHPAIDLRSSVEDIAMMPAGARRAWEQYGFVDSIGSAVLCGDAARFFNHSIAPNVGTPANGDPEVDVALAEIAAGAELLCDYRKFGPGLCRAFLDPPPIP